MTGGQAATVALAPGRVNLIGEHTDYNGGFVLPTVIPQQTRVALVRRNDGDRSVVVQSSVFANVGNYVVGQEARTGDWLDYVQGVTWALGQLGVELVSGFDLRIDSTVPPGAGLSSSAALEIALLRAIRQAIIFDLAAIDDLRLAQLGQLAENEFVGARCGIMDQMAVSLADAASALFLDTRTLDYRRVPLPTDADVVVLHSGVSHDLSRGDYNTRRAECETAARLLGVPQLRDVTMADLARLEALPELLRRRARHVVTENERVLQTVASMEAGNTGQLGALFAASHASMRDDFEVSVPEVDLLVDLAAKDPDGIGARLTGGGFGGSVVVFVARGRAPAAADRIARRYADRSGREPTVLVPPAAASS